MTIGDITDLILDRVGDFQPAVMSYYTAREIGKAVNTIQNLFVFLTLCLETTGTLATVANQTDYHLLQTFPDYLVPLRVRIAGGAKVRPNRISELAALDNNWRAARGTISRYAVSGFDYFATYRTSATIVSLPIDYARSPTQLPDPTVTPGAVPEIPAEYHQALIDGAIPLLRAKEGAGEWQKVLPQWGEFMAAVNKMAAYVRRRNVERGYDTLPPELARFDASVWLKANV